MQFGKKIRTHSIYKLKWFICIFFILHINLMYADWNCYPNIDFQNQSSILHNSRILEKAVIRAKVWKIHNENGIFEMTDNAIENGLENLINSFKDYGILVNFLDFKLPIIGIS